MFSATEIQRAKELVQKVTLACSTVTLPILRRIEDDAARRLIELDFLKIEAASISKTTKIALPDGHLPDRRFLLHLVKDADDQLFTNARARGETPKLALTLFSDRLVAECNRDAFTESDLRRRCQFCSLARKPDCLASEFGTEYAYLFSAAWKVHIQSGPFSFSFTHKPGDTGLGMILPEWEDATNTGLPDTITRTTLYFHCGGQKELGEEVKKAIEAELLALQPETLLFTRNLRALDVNFLLRSGPTTSPIRYLAESTKANGTVRKLVNESSPNKTSKLYYVTGHSDTPSGRPSSIVAGPRGNPSSHSSPSVILAFPLGTTLSSGRKFQNLFSVLPIKEARLPFAVHADFVANAERTDIDNDNQRNKALVAEISKAFLNAVLKLCDDDGLKYKWIQYLPDKSRRDWDPFFLSLVNGIAKLIGEADVLYAQKWIARQRLRDVYWPPPWLFDSNGDFLFSESGNTALSKSYSPDDVNRLQEYGLGTASFERIYGWLLKDLESKTRSVSQPADNVNDWHDSVARLLQMRHWNEKQVISCLKDAPIVPLEDGTWTSPTANTCVLDLNGVDIPSDLGDLRIVSRTVQRGKRLDLFKKLGVRSIKYTDVCNAIIERYGTLSEPKIPTFEQSIQHVKFLYHGWRLNENSACSLRQMQLFTEDKTPLPPRTSNIYGVSGEMHSPFALLSNTEFGRFVNSEYYNATNHPEKVPAGRSFSEWLYNALGVLRNVPFETDERLSEPAIYIKDNKPDKFLGALRLWYLEHGSRQVSEKFTNAIGEATIPCENQNIVPIKDTAFPLESLKELVNRFVEPGAFFPWLPLDAGYARHIGETQWTLLLTNLKLGIHKSDLEFALKMLANTTCAFPASPSPESVARLFDLYNHILLQFRKEKDSQRATDDIKRAFTDFPGVYIPQTTGEAAFATPDTCVWQAAQELSTKHCLEKLYRRFKAFMTHTKELWTDVLDIKNCTSMNYVDELMELQAVNSTGGNKIAALYRALLESSPGIFSEQTKIIDLFETHALVFFQSPSSERNWYRPSECLWRSVSVVRQGPELTTRYPDLRELFVNVLLVRLSEISTIVEQLTIAGNKEKRPCKSIKALIWELNGLLERATEDGQAGDIGSSRIFPVRHPSGDVVCESMKTEFFLNNSERLNAAFRQKVKILDFNAGDTNKLRPFLKWSGLNKRYLASRVRDVVSLDEERAVPIDNAHRQICNRAKALLNLAAHFTSPRAHDHQAMVDLYRALKDCRTFSASVVRTGTALKQGGKEFLADGKEFLAEGKRPTAFVSEVSGEIDVYIPEDKDDQDYVFTTKLPHVLLHWLMTDPKKGKCKGYSKSATAAVTHVLLAPLNRIALALEDCGIADQKLDEVAEVAQTVGSIGTELRNGVHDSPCARMVKDAQDGRAAVELLRRANACKTAQSQP